MVFFRPTKAEIDLNALASNFRAIKEVIPDNVGILAMVKADAYGHGAVQVSRVLERLGVKALSVATVEEGLELRSSGIKCPIIVMGGLMGMGSPASGMMIGADLTPVVSSIEVLDSLDSVARAAGKRIDIHIKIDTGMSRLGILPRALPRFLDHLKTKEYLRLAGVMTHLAHAGDAGYTEMQMQEFDSSVKKIKGVFGCIPVWHVANSLAVIEGRSLESDTARESWVRPGIMLYGVAPFEGIARLPRLTPVMSIKTRLALIKSVPPRTKVSYECTFETKRPTTLGVIPIGYADGYPWALSNKAQVLVEGKRAPVVGRVTMDMVVIDITEIKEAHVGSEVVLMGRQGCDEINVLELARLAGTIPYEIFCGISKRMPRMYIED